MTRDDDATVQGIGQEDAYAPPACNRRAWLQEDQEADNPCVCGLDEGHEGLHQCFEGCAGEWAGGLPAADVEVGGDS